MRHLISRYRAECSPNSLLVLMMETVMRDCAAICNRFLELTPANRAERAARDHRCNRDPQHFQGNRCNEDPSGQCPLTISKRNRQSLKCRQVSQRDGSADGMGAHAGRGTLKKELQEYLRRTRTMRRSRHHTMKTDDHRRICGTVSISERPPTGEDRAIPAHLAALTGSFPRMELQRFAKHR